MTREEEDLTLPKGPYVGGFVCPKDFCLCAYSKTARGLPHSSRGVNRLAKLSCKLSIILIQVPDFRNKEAFSRFDFKKAKT